MKKSKKAKKVREQGRTLAVSLAELGIMAAKLEVTKINTPEGTFVGRMPAESFDEFFALWGDLHALYLRFGFK